MDRRSLLLAFAFVAALAATSSDALDPQDPNGDITIKWDVMSWTGDGYVAVVTMSNYQARWVMGWTWAAKEVIWEMVGSQATRQGDCSKFTGVFPHCCLRNPNVVGLLPGVPYNQLITNSCKVCALNSSVQDPSANIAAFQVTVGQAGTTNVTVKLPKNFTLLTPGPGYTCGLAKRVPSTKFPSLGGHRTTLALMTWDVTCVYSQSLASSAHSVATPSLPSTLEELL